MNKVVIAHAVLAGLAISQRLVALEVPHDKELITAVGDLAGSLATILAAVEILDQAIAVSIRLVEEGDTERALEGLNMIKEGTAELISEQDTIEAAMGVNLASADAEVEALIALLNALSGNK